MRVLLIFALVCYLPSGLATAETLTVAWRDKAPYHYLEDGHERGFLLLRAKRIFTAAKIAAVFVERPSKRIWLDFQNGKQNYCSIGWYQLPEREQIAQFSLPLHVDPPHVLLVNAVALPLVKAHDSLASLLADPRLSLGVVDGVSYGASLDRQIAGSANQIQRVTVSPTSMMHMLAANRINYMLADQADWQYLREHSPDDLSQIAEYHFNDMPAGLQRFIVCSTDVPADTMARLNRAITTASAAQH
jgi:uncharacterized protein (TIGR02285 family)